MDLERQLSEAKMRVKELENDVTAKEKRSTAGEQREKKERDAKEALAKEKTEKDSLLLATAQQVQQLEKEKAEKEKQLSAGEQREKKDREANEKLEREKMDRDRALADLKLKAQQSESDLKARAQQTENELKQRVAQLEKEKAEKEKQLAATQQREQQEREAKEKLQRDRQAAEARDAERKGWEAKAIAERDKQEAIPPLPPRIPEPVHCSIPEDVQGGADLFVNCVTQPGVRAKNIVFYYRPASSVLYNALVMDPTRKGWSRAVITANKLNGKLLQYYAEARDTHDTVAASNGKANSPNIVPIAGAGKNK
jgi:chemotaxis protein histidine kinase CheA